MGQRIQPGERDKATPYFQVKPCETEEGRVCTKLHRDERQDKEETKALSADLCHSIVELGATANDHSWSGRVGHPVSSSTNRMERTDEAFTRLSRLRLNNCFLSLAQ